MHVMLLTQDSKSVVHLGNHVIYDIADPLLQLPMARFEVRLLGEQLRCLLCEEANWILELTIPCLRKDFRLHPPLHSTLPSSCETA